MVPARSNVIAGLMVLNIFDFYFYPRPLTYIHMIPCWRAGTKHEFFAGLKIYSEGPEDLTLLA